MAGVCSKLTESSNFEMNTHFTDEFLKNSFSTKVMEVYVIWYKVLFKTEMEVKNTPLKFQMNGNWIIKNEGLGYVSDKLLEITDKTSEKISLKVASCAELPNSKSSL